MVWPSTVAFNARIIPGRARRARDQPVDREILGADAVERRQRAAEHVVAAAKRAGAFERPEIGELLDDADRRAVAPRVAADRARLDRVEIAADRTGPDRVGRPSPSPPPAASIRLSRRLIRCSAARRAERGPSPGSLASSWIRVSSSDKVVKLSADVVTRKARASERPERQGVPGPVRIPPAGREQNDRRLHTASERQLQAARQV